MTSGFGDGALLDTIKRLLRQSPASANAIQSHVEISSPSWKQEPLLLWSASCRLKYEIADRYYGAHFCWCSPVFEADAVGRYEIGARQPRSSNPASIYRDLAEYCRRPDRQDAKVASFMKTILQVAVDKQASGAISAMDCGKIAARLEYTNVVDWNPLMFVIPYASVASRVRQVPVEDAASGDPEYQIPDLQKSEFQIVEF
jgi:hypothetical protein